MPLLPFLLHFERFEHAYTPCHILHGYGSMVFDLLRLLRNITTSRAAGQSQVTNWPKQDRASFSREFVREDRERDM